METENDVDVEELSVEISKPNNSAIEVAVLTTSENKGQIRFQGNSSGNISLENKNDTKELPPSSEGALKSKIGTFKDRKK